jgi:hypothetical protein
MSETERHDQSAALDRLASLRRELESLAAELDAAEHRVSEHGSGSPATASPGRRRSFRLIGRALVLGLALLLPTVALASDRFSDVPDSNTFHNIINTVAVAGITKGCTTDTFCPATAVRRDQMTAFIVRAAGRMGRDTWTNFTPIADQPFAQVTIKTEGRAFIWANATTYMNLVRGASNFFPCQASISMQVDDVADASSIAYGVADSQPTVSGSITEQLATQSVKVVNGGTHIVELFYDGLAVGSCGVTLGNGYLTAMVVPFDETGTNP